MSSRPSTASRSSTRRAGGARSSTAAPRTTSRSGHPTAASGSWTRRRWRAPTAASSCTACPCAVTASSPTRSSTPMPRSSSTRPRTVCTCRKPSWRNCSRARRRGSVSRERLDLLREALPYIQRFKGKTFVVKLSGKVTEEPENMASLAEELALLHQVGIRVCVVHGGGKQLTELAAQMGVEQTIINGRRVTDDATLDMAKMIFAGKINTDILAALRRRGVPAVGLSGVDGNMVAAERRPPRDVLNRETGESKRIDFGHVGDGSEERRVGKECRSRWSPYH